MTFEEKKLLEFLIIFYNNIRYNFIIQANLKLAILVVYFNDI